MEPTHRLARMALLVVGVWTLGAVDTTARDGTGQPTSVEETVAAHPQFCNSLRHLQPNGPFAVMVFCEGALGTHVGVIYQDVMGQPGHGRWDLTDRFWQDWDWASDVTSFAWGLDGKRLYIGTSEIYGSGALYELDLLSRTHRRIAPKLSEGSLEGSTLRIYVITRLDSRSRTLYFEPGNQTYVMETDQ